jgi:hypothetical protein
VTAPLYEIAHTLATVRGILDVAEIDPETGEAAAPPDLLAVLDGLEGEYSHKLDACARVVRSLEAEGEMVEREAARLSARAEAITKSAARLREAMRQSLIATGTKSVRTDLFTIGLTASPERVEVTDLAAVPQMYRRAPPPPPPMREWAPDKDTAKRDLKGGSEIPGLTLVRGEPRLVIR